MVIIPEDQPEEGIDGYGGKDDRLILRRTRGFPLAATATNSSINCAYLLRAGQAELTWS